MSLTKRVFTPKFLVIIAFVVALAIGGYYLTRERINRRDMAELAPANTILYIQIDSLADLLTGLIKTEAWQKLSGPLGISEQLNYLGSTADALAITGLGPEEAVILARAQFAVVVDGLEAETKSGTSGEGQQLELQPRLGLIIETHARPDKAKVLIDRLNLLAKRIYGPDVQLKEESHQGIAIKIFQTANSNRQLVAAQRDSLVFVGNHPQTIKSCLDVATQRAAKLSEDASLQRVRAQLPDNTAPIFAFVPGVAVSRILQFTNFFLSMAKSAEGSQQQAEMLKSLSQQLVNGVAYTATFEQGQVAERYLTLLNPAVAQELQLAVKPATQSALLKFLQRIRLDFWTIRVADAGITFERFIKIISARANVVVSFALRNIIIDLSTKYGLDDKNPIGDLVNEEIAYVKFSQQPDTEQAMVIAVKDKAKLLPVLSRYLRSDQAPVNSEQYRGLEIVSGSEQRAAVFIENFLVLGKRDQILQLIDISQTTAAAESLVNPGPAILISNHNNQEVTGQFMLNISRILRVTDGSQEILTKPQVKSALAELPPAIGKLEIIENGLLYHSVSALGPFTLAATLISEPAGELKESQSVKAE